MNNLFPNSMWMCEKCCDFVAEGHDDKIPRIQQKNQAFSNQNSLPLESGEYVVSFVTIKTTQAI